MPLANTEGGLSISLFRGAKAAAESGGFRTHVLHDRVTRASAFLFDSTADAVAFSRWIEPQVVPMRDWLAGEPIGGLSKHAKLRELETHVVGPTCHVLYAYTTGDAVGMNMITRNSYALNQGFVLENAPVKPKRAVLEGNMGGDKKPSHRYFERGGHGKTVIAECTLTEEAVRRVLEDHAGRPRRPRLRRHARRRRVRDAVGRVHAGDRNRSALHRHGPGRRHGRHELDGARDGATRWTAACTRRSGSRASRWRPSAAARPSPPRNAWLSLLDCAGAGKVYRFAQIVAAATLALEISASAAMATAGSENFYKAHFERGGLR